MTKGIGNIIGVFKAMPAGKRISFLITFVIVIGGFIALLAYTNRPAYVTLFSGMDSSEASKVVERLKELGAKYTFSVKVPDDMVHQLSLDMAKEGILPRGGNVEFEIFDITPELEQEYQKALQSELERTIKESYTIDQVWVHIVSAVKSTSAHEGKPVAASVALKRHPGSELNAVQLQKIVNFVSASVKGLKSENVAIVDMEKGTLTKGNDLTTPKNK